LAILLRSIFVAAIIALCTGTAYVMYGRGQVHDLTIAAGASAGEAFVLASAIAEVVERHNPKARITVLETRGSADNVRLLEEGRVDFATVQADMIAGGRSRLVATLYPDAFQLVARANSGIEGFADLSGMRIALPVEGGGEYDSFWRVAEHYGMTASEVVALPMSPDAARLALQVGAADAVFRVRAPGNAMIGAMVAESDARPVEIEQSAALRLRDPSLEVGTIPKGSYRGDPAVPERDLATAAVRRLLLARADLKPEFVHEFVFTLFERRRELLSITPLAGFIEASFATSGTFVPLHDGARRYYDREKPSFLQENAEQIALILSIIAVLGSGALRLLSDRRKGRLDSYNHELLSVYTEAAAAKEPSGLRVLQTRLMTILGRVVDDAEEGRLTTDGFGIFSFTWDAVNDTIRDRLERAETGSQEVREVDDGQG